MNAFIYSIIISMAPSLAWACSIRVGHYICDNAPITEIGKKNVVVREMIFSKNGTDRKVVWYLTGDVWINDSDTAGHFEKKNVQYVFDLKAGKTKVSDDIFNTVKCEKNGDGVKQVYFTQSMYVPTPDLLGSDIMIYNIRYSQATNMPKMLSVAITTSNNYEFFNCYKK